MRKFENLRNSGFSEGIAGPIAGGVFALLLAVSLWIWADIRKQAREQTEAAFQQNCEEWITAFATRIREQELALHAMEALLIGSEEVDRREFERTARRILEWQSELSALEWAPRVEASQRQAFERGVAAAGFQDYAIRDLIPGSDPAAFEPAAPAGNYYPVLFVEPLTPNQPALGFNLLSGKDAARVSRALETGHPALSSISRLYMTDASPPWGLVLFHPVFSELEEADGAPEGVLVALFRLDTLLDFPQRETLHLRLFTRDGGETQSPTGIRVTANAVLTEADTGPEVFETAPGTPHLTREIQFWDTRWEAIFEPDPRWLASQKTAGPEAILALLALASGLASWLLYGHLRKNHRIHEEVRARTRELQTARKRLEDDLEVRRQAEARAAQRTEELKAIIENIPAMIAFFGSDGEIRLVNRQWETCLGWDLAAMRAHPDVMSEFYPDPEDRRHALEHIATADGSWAEFSTTLPDGRKIPTLWANVRLPSGGIIGIGQDLTERKELEERYIQAQKMESIGRLAGGIAHDFNNILVPIMGFSDFLEKCHPTGTPEREYVEQIQQAAERAKGLTNQILAFSRQQVLEPRVLDLNSLVGDFEKMLRRLIGEDIAFVVIPFTEPLEISGDPGRLEQVLLNLAVNARDAMPDGGRLTLELGRQFLDDDYVKRYAEDLPPGHYAFLSFSDSGKGIARKQLRQIWEPFFTTKARGRGTGLGLSTVLGIVRQHNGNISVYSELGKGTTFKVFLPLAGADSAPEPRPEAKPHRFGTRNGERILVVEDEEAVRRIVEATLVGFGYQVAVADSAADAVRLLAEATRPFDLLLTDVVLPDQNGRELHRRLFELQPGLPVLFMSGYTGNVVVHHGILDAGIAFIQKPFSTEALAAKVRDTLAPRQD